MCLFSLFYPISSPININTIGEIGEDGNQLKKSKSVIAA
jgi:hypothetical protein